MMVNYPTHSSVVAVQARVLLNRILRKYHGATLAGKLAIAEQFQHFAYNTGFTTDAVDYPTANEPSAQAVRKDITDLARLLITATNTGRTQVLAAAKAAVLSVGGTILPMVGTGGGATPVLQPDGRYLLDVLVAVPTLSNIACIDWGSAVPALSLDTRYQGQTGLSMSVFPEAEPREYRAYCRSLDGTSLAAITFNVPAATPEATLKVSDNMYDKAILKALTKTQLVQLATGVKTLEELQGATS